MKRLLLLIALLLPLVSLALPVADTVINIDHLNENGFLLKKGWKFKSGDDRAYARADFDDSNWQAIDPTVYLPEIPVAAQHGIGWMRIKLHIPPKYRNSAALRISKLTPAIEIYLNGRLVGKRGTIDSLQKTGRGYIEIIKPIELPAINGDEQVLAIRFANQPFLDHFDRFLTLPFLQVTFTNTAQLLNYINTNQAILFANITGTSILLLLALFHLTLLAYHNKNKANLYFAIYAFLYGSFSICGMVFNFSPHFVDADLFFQAAYVGLFIASGLIGTKALCLLFAFRPGIYYRVLVIVAVCGWLSFVFTERFKLNLLITVAILVVLGEVWFTLKAVWYKRRGAIIVATGFFASFIGASWYLYLFTHSYELIPVVISVAAALLGPALSISLFLGREFALDGQLLGIKLHEVEELSAKNLAQEQEKQHILASQNETLEKQVAERTAELNQSLNNLKLTQTQLIQAEKMASLGELTAGIAHEIQNPLNFVNNFSELNKEMIDELKEELQSGNINEAMAIADDIQRNEDKINHHGKRADFIVKGMLQHSRTGTGERQLTNINILAEEFLKLSYHGLRAKDKGFNAVIMSNFDVTLPKVNIVQQDIGRVLLNLFNNAFYAVNQKQKSTANYTPEISVTTSSSSTSIIIEVKDNGNGIPDAIKDKIMQPFFTTKPTGEGTGLGLSLSYDIVVKGHGGNLAVESKDGEGSTFTVKLPIS